MRSIVHIEIPSSDDGAVKEFYSALCGWKIQEIPMGPDFTYVIFDTANVSVALSATSEDIQPGDVILYFHSDDLDADIARAAELGGEIVLPRQDIPGFGSLGIFKDPTGNRVAFWQSADPAQA